MKRLFLGIVPILLVCVCSFTAFAQKTVSGRITASEDGAPLRGVKVLAKGTKVGAFSDAKGEYRLAVPEGSSILVFSYIGFASREVNIANRDEVNVKLDFDTKSLDDVVVTAFGIEREKKALGYAVQEVSAKEIQQSQQSNLVNALQGRVAGVTIGSGGGAVGAGSSIIVRGITSISPGRDNQPLFVIDGIPVSNQTAAGSVRPSSGSNATGDAEQFSQTNRIADFNPEEIENISILKGPAATALYGSRAANGVVVITTKRGAAGEFRVNVKLSGGLDQVGKTPTIQRKWSSGRRGEYIDPAIAVTDPNAFAFWELGPPRSLSNAPFYDNDNRLLRTGIRSDNAIEISTGTEGFKFYGALGRFDQVGIVPGTNFSRTNVSLRTEIKPVENFTINASAMLTNSGGTRPSGGDRSIFSAYAFWSPSWPIDSAYGDNYLPTRGPITANSYTAGVVTHPVYMATASPFTDNVNRLTGDIALNWQIASWLKARYQFTVDTYNDTRNRLAPPDVDVGIAVNGFIINEKRFNTEMNSQLFLTGTWDLTDDIRLNAMVGNAITDIKFDGTVRRGETFKMPNVYTFENVTRDITLPLFQQRRFFAVFGDVQLSFKDILFLQATARNELSSTLPKNNNSFFYPAVNASFNFTDLLKPALGDFLSFGKLRASWARAGKDADPYSLGEYFEQSTLFPIGGANAFVLRLAAGDLNLKPEITTGIEFGTDLRFFDNRLTIDASYFIQRSENQIVAAPVSNASGFDRLFLNAGVIENTGVELLVGITPVVTDNFRWDMSLNWSQVRGVVLEMPPGIDEIIVAEWNQAAATSKIVKGGRPGDMYGVDFRRNSKNEIIIEADGLPRVNEAKPVLIGNAFPDWQGGINNTFTFNTGNGGAVNFSFLWEFRQGGTVVDMAERNRYRNGVAGWTDIRYTNVVWNGVNEIITRTPGSTPGTVRADTTYIPNTIPNNTDPELTYRGARINIAQQFQFDNSSWIRLRNVSLGWTLPRDWFAGGFVKGVRATLTGNNLWLTTPFRGYDPDNASFGSGSNGFGFVGRNTPQTRGGTLTLNFTF